MRRFTERDKLAGIERELGYRRKIFPGRVEAGKMPQETADRQIALFEQIAEDYRERVEAEIAKGRLL